MIGYEQEGNKAGYLELFRHNAISLLHRFDIDWDSVFILSGYTFMDSRKFEDIIHPN